MEKKRLSCRLDRAARAILVGGAVGLLLAGCAPLGARALREERIHLNMAFQQTNDEQLLLNLVRLRYRDTPAFIEVGSISSQWRRETSVQAGAELERKDAVTDLFRFGAGALYATQPTLTYTPLQGEPFIQRLLTPLAPERLALLYHSGWTIKQLFLVCVQGMNGVKNAPRASGPTPGRAPEYRDFLRALDLMHELEKTDALDFAYESRPAEGSAPRLVLQLYPDPSNASRLDELRRILNLDAARTTYPIVTAQIHRVQPRAETTLRVDARSVLGVMYFLSNAVEIPAADVEARRLKIARDEIGQPMDWRPLFEGVFSIKSQPSPPSGAVIAASYRGYWFWIDDTDIKSKATFAMLSQIFSLQAGKLDAVIPALTLPVGR